MTIKKKQVTVVIPIWKSWLTNYERISLQQGLNILNKHHFTIITYRNIDLKNVTDLFNKYSVDYKVIYFSKKKFRHIGAYNRLLLSLSFYLSFRNYEYILIYQLDCFVFKDELRKWLRMNYSYIGAPWVVGYNQVNPGASVFGSGNGGFSLRRVKHHIRVLLSFKYIIKAKNLKNKIGKKFSDFEKLYFMATKLTVKNNCFALFNDWEKNEDIFWARVACRNFDWFEVPEWRTAAQFSIENQPKRFFIANTNKLPFGCHAWWKYDLWFWKPYIENFGYSLEN